MKYRLIPLKSISIAVLLSGIGAPSLADNASACDVLRATDLANFLGTDVGYNSFSIDEGWFRIQNCQAIDRENNIIFLQTKSFLAVHEIELEARRTLFLDSYDASITYLEGIPETENAVYHASEDNVLFWSKNYDTMYIVTNYQNNVPRLRAAVREIAQTLGLEKEYIQEMRVCETREQCQ